MENIKWNHFCWSPFYNTFITKCQNFHKDISWLQNFRRNKDKRKLNHSNIFVTYRCAKSYHLKTWRKSAQKPWQSVECINVKNEVFNLNRKSQPYFLFLPSTSQFHQKLSRFGQIFEWYPVHFIFVWSPEDQKEYFCQTLVKL